MPITLFLTVTVIFILILWVVQNESNKKRNNDLLDQYNAAVYKVSTLIKYEGILDAEKKAKEIIEEAQKSSRQIVADAYRDIQLAKNEAKDIRAKAKEQKENAQIKSDKLLEEADKKADELLKEAQRIINSAHKKAEEIAGDGYNALQNAREWEQTAKAMKNIIEGYGDNYLKPTYSLLDDLADDFSHTEFLTP